MILIVFECLINMQRKMSIKRRSGEVKGHKNQDKCVNPVARLIAFSCSIAGSQRKGG